MAITQTDAIYPAPIIFAAEGDKLDRDLLIREAYWTGIGTDGDDLIISDYDSSAILVKGKGVANDWVPLTPLFGQRVAGLKLTTMDSGQILIYL